MLCNIKPVPFHESDKHIFAKIPGGGGGSGPPVPPSGSAHKTSPNSRTKALAIHPYSNPRKNFGLRQPI